MIIRQSTASDDDSGCALEEYSWAPTGLKPAQIHQYFQSIPDDKIPYVNSIGEKWRVKQLIEQLPPHDNDARYCNSLTPSEKEQLKLFSQQRKRENLGRAVARQLPLTDTIQSYCKECNKIVENGSIGIFAARSGPEACWHPSCFRCTICRELLVDLIYFFNSENSKIYCGRHHAELIKPRCPACDELIFSDECTEAEGKSWHLQHFSCMECFKSLGGQRYFIKKSKPFCLECFEKQHTELCATCGMPIGVEQGQISYEGQYWHARDDCFKCSTCEKPLQGGATFIPRHGQVYCSNSCLKTIRKTSNSPPSYSKIDGFTSQDNFTKKLDISTSSINAKRNDHLSPQIIEENQSRSRKPLNLSYLKYPPNFMFENQNCHNLSANFTPKQQLMENSSTSFDDLDTVEEITLNQHTLTKLSQTNQFIDSLSSKQYLTANKYSNHIRPNFYFPTSQTDHPNPDFPISSGSSESRFHPASILKRVNSSKHISIEGSSIQRNQIIDESSNHSKSKTDEATCFKICDHSKGLHRDNPPVRKRVKFANAPSMFCSSSSEGDLSTLYPNDFSSSKPTANEELIRNTNFNRRLANFTISDDIRQHKPKSGSNLIHHHCSHSRRRSSSISNIINPRNNYSRSSLRQLSNRSLNMTSDIKSIHKDIDVGDLYETASAHDYEDDDQTCSTCSSTLTTTSTDSESDLDDFNFDTYYKVQSSKHLPIFNKNLKSDWKNERKPSIPLGLKISYVDSLPLARTNPAQQTLLELNKTETKKAKSKTLKKFKKENCVIS